MADDFFGDSSAPTAFDGFSAFAWDTTAQTSGTAEPVVPALNEGFFDSTWDPLPSTTHAMITSEPDSAPTPPERPQLQPTTTRPLAQPAVRPRLAPPTDASADSSKAALKAAITAAMETLRVVSTEPAYDSDDAVCDVALSADHLSSQLLESGAELILALTEVSQAFTSSPALTLIGIDGAVMHVAQALCDELSTFT